MKLVIEMQDRENYAAHGGFTGKFRWKYKIGETYIIENFDNLYDLDLIENEVYPLIEESTSNYLRSEVAAVFTLEDDQETEFEQRQREYDPSRIRCPTELRRNKKGAWYSKSGYLFDGEFYGAVHELKTGKCVKRLG